MAGLYLDVGLADGLAALLRNRGHTVRTAVAANLDGAPAPIQLEFAITNGLVLVTPNLSDIQPLHADLIRQGQDHGRRGRPPRTAPVVHNGIIGIETIHTAATIRDGISAFLSGGQFPTTGPHLAPNPHLPEELYKLAGLRWWRASIAADGQLRWGPHS